LNEKQAARCEALYEKGLKVIDKQKKVAADVHKERVVNELNGVTFCPRINEKSQKFV
jgi:hypothetical protein